MIGGSPSTVRNDGPGNAVAAAAKAIVKINDFIFVNNKIKKTLGFVVREQCGYIKWVLGGYKACVCVTKFKTAQRP